MGGEGVAEPQSHCPEQAEQFVDMEQWNKKMGHLTEGGTLQSLADPRIV